MLLQAELLNNMAIIKKNKKLIEDAILLYDESFAIANKIGDKTGAAQTARAGIEAAKVVNNAEYIRLNEKILAQASQ
jgi:hypothetical protein